jgi:hypothetical protein
MADPQTQERFVGALRPEARGFTGRPELCWSFWIKGQILEDGESPGTAHRDPGNFFNIPEATLASHMRNAFGTYLAWACENGYFPAMERRVSEWHNNPETRAQDVDAMTNPEMLKIDMEHESLRANRHLQRGDDPIRYATIVTIRWGGTAELSIGLTPSDDANPVWLLLPMVEMFNRLVNEPSVSGSDPRRAMESLNETIFGFRIGSLRVSEYNFPIVIGERPHEHSDTDVDFSSGLSIRTLSGSEYREWYCAMDPPTTNGDVFNRRITIDRLEDHHQWKESSTERYIQWSMLCKNVHIPNQGRHDIESMPVGRVEADAHVYETLRRNLGVYLHGLQSQTSRLVHPELTPATVSALANTFVSHWASSEHLEIWVEKTAVRLQDAEPKPAMRICVKWKLPKNVAIDMLHDLRYDEGEEQRTGTQAQAYIANDVAKLFFCRIPAAEFPNYSNRARKEWVPVPCGEPLDSLHWRAWRESVFQT